MAGKDSPPKEKTMLFHDGKIKEKKQWDKFVKNIYYQAGIFIEKTGNDSICGTAI